MKSVIYSRYNPLPLILPLHAYIKLTGQQLILPVYHTVSNDYIPHIANLYKYKNIKAFKVDLDYLLRHYKPVDLYQLTDHIRGGKPIRGKAFFLSFDDGLSEFYNIIAPLLKQKGIPATCFLNSNFIDNKDLFFRYKISLLIDTISNQDIKPQTVSQVRQLLNIAGIKWASIPQALLNVQYNNKELPGKLAELLGLDFAEYLAVKKPYMTSGQIRELMAEGFTFGSHSIDHPEYRFIDTHEQLKQTTVSTKIICDKFKLNYRVFAFPFTDYGVSKNTFDNIHSAGDIDLSFGCAGMKHDCIPFNLQRIPAEDYNLPLKRRLKADYFYFILKSIVRRNNICR